MANRKDRKQRVEEEIQRTIESLDSLVAVEASPFFMTRLMQAVQDRDRQPENWLYRITLGYKLVPASLALFILLNATTLIIGIAGSRMSREMKTFSLQEAAQDYYSLGTDAWENTQNLSRK